MIIKAGIELIKHFESLHDGDLTQIGLQPKLAPEGLWTAGWGHLIIDPSTKKSLPEEQKKRAYELMGSLTLEQAEELLVKDLGSAEERVRRSLIIAVTDYEKASLVSLAYNLRSYEKLAKYLGQDKSVFKEKMLLYCKDINGSLLKGLKIRRISERLLFENREWKVVVGDLQKLSIKEMLDYEKILFG